MEYRLNFRQVRRNISLAAILTSPVFDFDMHVRTMVNQRLKMRNGSELREDSTKEDVSTMSMIGQRVSCIKNRFWPRWIAYAERFGVEV